MVNITMLARDRFTLTAQAIASLGLIEGATVTILDDRSDPPTASLLKEYCRVSGGRYYRNEEALGTGMLRNCVINGSALRVNRGDYLYLSDNDVFFRPGWLETLIQCYEFVWRHGFRVLGAYNHPFHQPVSTFVARLPERDYQVAEVQALALQSMIMKWEVWDEFGPFCDTPVDRVCQSEDVDFARKIHAAGFKLGVVSPALVVSTGITNTFGEKIPGWELVKAQCPEGVICE
jgi:GT2 family glycosyltransferase